MKKTVLLIMLAIILIPITIGTVYHVQHFVVPTVLVHEAFNQVSGTAWRTVRQIRFLGYGNCTDLDFVLMDDLGDTRSILLITERSGNLHAAVMVGNIVLDPTIPSVKLYKNYMRGRNLVDMIPKKDVNRYVGMEVFE